MGRMYLGDDGILGDDRKVDNDKGHIGPRNLMKWVEVEGDRRRLVTLIQISLDLLFLKFKVCSIQDAYHPCE